MDYKPLPVGVDNFEKLITRGYYFIDKTKMVQELVDKKDFKLAYEALCEEIAREYNRHYFVCESDALLPSEKEKYISILAQKAQRGEFNTSLQFLSQCLEKYYGKKSIILLDEYDVPLENAFMRGFYNEMIEFIRSLFESAFKTNSSLEFAVLTGCLRISKESIFTGMNNLEIISILNKNYDEYFGFTEEEIEALIEGKTIEKPIHEDITCDEVYKTMDNLWKFMFFTGYFKKVSERMDDNTQQHYAELMIPNKEVKYIFRTKILSWFQEKIEEKDLLQVPYPK